MLEQFNCFWEFQAISLNAAHSFPLQHNAFLESKSDLHQNYLDSLQCLRNFVLQENDMLDCVIDSVLIRKHSPLEWVSLLEARLLLTGRRPKAGLTVWIM